jgi:DNA-binding winged helix-turn-helix (wHTH) protein/TolB-like protein/Flp pilus assembly protein TadD
MQHPTKELYEFGGFQLDAIERLLLRDGSPVQLKPKTFDTLLALVRQSGHLVGKNELMQEVWPDSFVEEINLTVNISALRKILGENGAGQRYIETVPKRGYRFVAPVTEIANGDILLVKRRTTSISVKDEEEETDIPASAPLSATNNVRAALSLRKVLTAGALFVSLIALLFFWITMKSRPNENATALKPEIRSIAVLPFKPMIADAGRDEYLGNGMADSLIYRLGNLKGLVVRPINATMKYSGATQDPSAAGRELKVDVVLDGRVQKSGDRVWVTVQLISVKDGAPLWTQKFDQKFNDIFQVQDEIAYQVTQRLRPALTSQKKESPASRDPKNEAAYEAYTKGRYFLNQRMPEGYLKAYQYFQQAISLDPKYAPAYAGIADSYLLGGARLPTGMELDAPKVYAMKALEIDDTLAEAHTSLAYAKSAIDWDWQSAEAEFRRAIEINPNYPLARHWYAFHLVSLGRIDEAIAEIEQAQEIDPTSLIINTDVGHILYFAHRYDEAIAQYLKVLEMDPDFRVAHWRLGEAYERKGLYSKAIAELRESLERSNDAGALTWLGHAYAVSGQKDEALKIIAQLKGYRPEIDYAYYLALIYEGLGEKDEAFAWLQEAFDTHDGAMAVIQAEPMLDDLRSDHRYMELLRRMKLRA